MKKLWEDYSTVSTRALAVWRISLGAAAAASFIYFWQTAHIFFGPVSPLNKEPLPFWFPAFDIHTDVGYAIFYSFALAVSLAFSAGVPGAKWVLPFLHAMAGQKAHGLITGGSAVLALALALCWLLPVERDLSIMSWKSEGKWLNEARMVKSPAYPLVLFQLAVNYGFNTWNKLTDPWESGVAVELALSHPGLAKPLGAWLNEHASWTLSGANYGTLLVESLLPLLLLSPFRRRTSHRIAALLMFALHLGIHFTLQVGVFGLIMLAQIPILLFQPADPQALPRLATPQRVERARNFGAIAYLYLILFSLGMPGNVAGFRTQVNEQNPFDLPPPIAKFTAAMLWSQGWGMFATPFEKTYVIFTEARTRSGKVFDPWRAVAANDPNPRKTLPRVAVTRHVFSNVENFLPNVERVRLAFSEWMLAQTYPGDPNDPVAEFAVFTVSVPADHRYRPPTSQLFEHMGHHRSIGGSIPIAAVESFGVWGRERAMDGFIVDEGTSILNPAGAAFAPGCSYLLFRFDGPRDLKSIYLQADGANRYTIESSSDGKTFEPLVQTERSPKGHFRSSLVAVDAPGVVAIRVRQTRHMLQRGQISEMAFFEGMPPIPSREHREPGRFMANYERPAVAGLMGSSASGTCNWN